MKFFIDTSICVDVLRTNGPEKSLELFESFQERNDGFVSAITVAELSAGAHLSTRSDAVEKTEALLGYVEVIDLDEAIAIEGGKIFAALSGAGKKIEFNDCLIAATALSLGIPGIVTRNCGHFAWIQILDPDNRNMDFLKRRCTHFSAGNCERILSRSCFSGEISDWTTAQISSGLTAK